MNRLNMATSDDTILRRLRHRTHEPIDSDVRVIGVDEWACSKGQGFGTILVDLGQGQVVDVLTEGSANALATWLAAHPGVTTISRGRQGESAEGARRVAPNATQVADRFHLTRSPREAVEQRRQEKRQLFQRIHQMKDGGMKVSQIAWQLGINRRRVEKWVWLKEPPERSPIQPRPRRVESFREYLREKWEQGCHHGRQLYAEIRQLTYVGCYSRLAKVLAPWRQAEPESTVTTTQPLLGVPVESPA